MRLATHSFSSSTSESELSEEEDEDEEEEDDDDEDEEELELLLLLALPLAATSVPFTAPSFLTVGCDGWRAAGDGCFLFGPRDEGLASCWRPAGDLWEALSDRRESDCELLLPEAGAEDESLEGPSEEEERLFGSGSGLFTSSGSGLRFLSVGAFVSFISRGGDGEDDDEEEELEEDEDEEELRGWGTTFGCTGSFSLSLSCCASLCLVLSVSLLSLEMERLVRRRRCGEGDRRDLEVQK